MDSRRFTRAICAALSFAALSVLVLALSTSAALAQGFADLPAAEQTILRPLASDWDAMNATRKKKWRDLATRYPSLSPDEQLRLTTRMQGWARMTPEDRRAARDQFREITGPQAGKPESREQIKKQWQEYRNLPAEERNRLVQESRRNSATQNRSTEAVKRSGTPPLPPVVPPQPQSARAPVAKPAL